MLRVLFEKERRTYGTHHLKNRFAEQDVIMSRRHTGRLMVQAGLWCKTNKGLVWHTDRGSQYASDSH